MKIHPLIFFGLLFGMHFFTIYLYAPLGESIGRGMAIGDYAKAHYSCEAKLVAKITDKDTK